MIATPPTTSGSDGGDEAAEHDDQQPARQVRVGEVLVPRHQHAVHPGVVVGSPHDRIPVGVQDQQPPTGAQDALRLGQRGRHVGDVLIDLRRRDGVEASVRHREFDRLTGDVGQPGCVRAMLGPRDRQHLLTRIDSQQDDESK